MCVLSNIGIREPEGKTGIFGYIKMIEAEKQKNIINRSICYKIPRNPRKVRNIYIYI